MTYTKEQLEQIKKVEEVFADFISNSPEVDLLYSKKIGYVLFCGLTATEGTELIFQPQIMKDRRNLCYLLLLEVANDALRSIHNVHDIHECGPMERSLIEKWCAPYMHKLPEYADLVASMFK